MAVNVKKSGSELIYNLFELDSNDDDMPIILLPVVFETDNNEDIMPSGSIFEVLDQEFELDSNMDIMPRE